MHFLLSNDDGYQSTGIELLAEALSKLGKVTVVAPDRNRSGASNSLTLDAPLYARTAANGFIYVNGTPTDCVHIAITGLLHSEPDMVISGINASDAFVQLAGVENAEGVVTVLFGHQTWETDNPGVQEFLNVMDTYAPAAPVENFTEYGYIIAELTVEAIRRAGPDLTREGLIDALESIKGFQCSLCFAPISFSPTDHRPFEIETYVRLEGGRWVPFGDLVDFESTPQ